MLVEIFNGSRRSSGVCYQNMWRRFRFRAPPTPPPMKTTDWESPIRHAGVSWRCVADTLQVQLHGLHGIYLCSDKGRGENKSIEWTKITIHDYYLKSSKVILCFWPHLLWGQERGRFSEGLHRLSRINNSVFHAWVICSGNR